MLGHRVNALSIRGLRHRFRPVADGVEVARTGRWERVAHAVMRRPIAVLIPTLAFLLIVGSPFLRLEQGVPGAEIYPPGVESRDAYVALQTEFAPGETTPIIDPGRRHRARPTDLANIQALDAYAAKVDALEGIDRVESPFIIHDPATGALLTPEQVAALYALPAGQRPAGRRRPARAVRPRQHRPPRRDQPAPAVAPGGDRPDPGQIRAIPAGRRHHDPGRRQRRHRPRLPASRRRSARPTRSG